MSHQYAIKSWIYAAGVTAVLLFLMSLNSPAQALQSDEVSARGEPISAAPMQLARGGNYLVPSPRRTQNDKNMPSQATPEQSKDADKTAPGMQGPKGKTSDEEGPDGIKKTQPTDVTKS
jgi:hypothetical protein